MTRLARRRTKSAPTAQDIRRASVDILSRVRRYLGDPLRFQAAVRANLAKAGSEVEPVFFMMAAR